MKKTVLWSIGLLGLAVAVYVTDRAIAGDKAANDAIRKAAEAIKKGGKGNSEAEAAAKKIEDVDELMTVFKPRKKGGLGVGAPNSVTPDGIELKLIALGRDAPTPTSLAKEASALEDMAYDVAAAALVTKAKAPKTNMGKKTTKDWVTWSNDMHEAALKLAEAAKSKSAQDVKTAASKINAACNSCHSVFR